MTQKYDWDAIRHRYETDPDATQTALAKEFGCSRQAVQKRAKNAGWLRCSSVVMNLECSHASRGSKLGIRSEENIVEIIKHYALTGNKASACRLVGIDDKTLYNWCQKEPELSLIMQSEREAFLTGQIRKIADAADWKAAKEILSRAPETRDQWGETHDKGPTIILNIHRDEIVIES